MVAISTLAFDVYGTLIDTMGVTKSLEKYLGNTQYAENFSRQWRAKQLEYSFRRALMKDYISFSSCTRQALDYVDSIFSATSQQLLSSAAKEELMASYGMLPAFDDVTNGLDKIRGLGYDYWAFSNGERQQVEQLLKQAGIFDYFAGLVSVADVHSFKPDPAVYQHFIASTRSNADTTLLISSNPFDILGAMNSGWHTAWLQRNSSDVLDPWERQPSITLNDFNQLYEWLKSDG